MKLVAFDGTPVVGGAGVRMAILRRPDGCALLGPPRRRDLGPLEIEMSVAAGFVTEVLPPVLVPAHEGVVVYRHRDFVLPGHDFGLDEVSWLSRGDVEIAYVVPDAAVALLERWALAADRAAAAALERGDLEEAARAARRGLMVVPDLRTSEVARRLYLKIVDASDGGGARALVRREMKAMLDDSG